MIPHTELRWQTKTDANQSWKQILADVVRDPAELLALLDLPADQLPQHLAASKDFALRVPRPFVARMKPGDWHDPLLLQVLPQGSELDYQPGYSNDPLAEAQSNPKPGIIHKYHGRVLLILSGGCAINCRYCFRRHFPYQANNPSRSEWQASLNYIAEDPTIEEVILSGGDPLTVSDHSLTELIAQLENIPHVKTLRIHSRLPIVIPQRINASFLTLLTATRLNTVMVVHCNHPQEIDDRVGFALQQLSRQGTTVLNQSVLLKGINDDLNTLTELSQRLFQFGVLPYYLHLLDKVEGAAHFDVSEQQAQQLASGLLHCLPGYLVPKLVKEQPGALSKTPLSALL